MTDWNKYYDERNWHPAASIFPLMRKEDIHELAEDIKRTGLKEKIILYEGKVLDGRNRLVALNTLGYGLSEDCFVDLDYKDNKMSGPLWEDADEDAGASIVGFVVSANLIRRHLTAGQRAMLGAKITEALAAEAKKFQVAHLKQGKETPVVANLPPREKGKSVEKAGKLAKVSPRSIQKAKQVRKASPKLAEAVEKGKISLDAAHQNLPKKSKCEICGQDNFPSRGALKKHMRKDHAAEMQSRRPEQVQSGVSSTVEHTTPIVDTGSTPSPSLQNTEVKLKVNSEGETYRPEKRRNRSEPLESTEALFQLCRKMVKAGYECLKEQGEDPSHLWSAKTILESMIDKKASTP